MYRFLDRPVSDLDPGEQVLLWAMRSWVSAMTTQRCPCAVLGPSFERWKVADLLAGFNMTMFLLNVDGARPMRFCQPGCGQVRDDEAMLLGLFHAAAADEYRIVQRIAAQAVKPEVLNAFVAASSEAADVLRRALVRPAN